MTHKPMTDDPTLADRLAALVADTPMKRVAAITVELEKAEVQGIVAALRLRTPAPAGEVGVAAEIECPVCNGWRIAEREPECPYCKRLADVTKENEELRRTVGYFDLTKDGKQIMQTIESLSSRCAALEGENERYRHMYAAIETDQGLIDLVDGFQAQRLRAIDAEAKLAEAREIVRLNASTPAYGPLCTRLMAILVSPQPKTEGPK